MHATFSLASSLFVLLKWLTPSHWTASHNQNKKRKKRTYPYSWSCKERTWTKKKTNRNVYCFTMLKLCRRFFMRDLSTFQKNCVQNDGLVSHGKWNVMCEWGLFTYIRPHSFSFIFTIFSIEFLFFLHTLGHVHCYYNVSFDIWKEYKVLNYINEVFTLQCLSFAWKLITWHKHEGFTFCSNQLIHKLPFELNFSFKREE